MSSPQGETGAPDAAIEETTRALADVTIENISSDVNSDNYKTIVSIDEVFFKTYSALDLWCAIHGDIDEAEEAAAVQETAVYREHLRGVAPDLTQVRDPATGATTKAWEVKIEHGTKIQQLVAKNASMQDVIDRGFVQVEGLRAENSELRAELASGRKAFADLEKERDALKRELEALKKKGSDVEMKTA